MVDHTANDCCKKSLREGCAWGIVGSLHGSEGSRKNCNKSNRGRAREKRRPVRDLRRPSQATASQIRISINKSYCTFFSVGDCCAHSIGLAQCRCCALLLLLVGRGYEDLSAVRCHLSKSPFQLRQRWRAADRVARLGAGDSYPGQVPGRAAAGPWRHGDSVPCGAHSAGAAPGAQVHLQRTEPGRPLSETLPA